MPLEAMNPIASEVADRQGRGMAPIQVTPESSPLLWSAQFLPRSLHSSALALDVIDDVVMLGNVHPENEQERASEIILVR